MGAVIALDGTVLDDAYFDRLRATRELAAQEGLVRGRPFYKWVDAIAQHKRDGQFDDALILACECMDASARVNVINGGDGNGGWHREVAVILRKLGNYAEEVAFIERILKQWPDYSDLQKRLPAARKLAAVAALDSAE